LPSAYVDYGGKCTGRKWEISGGCNSAKENGEKSDEEGKRRREEIMKREERELENARNESKRVK
jgi:hypothetical protein